MAKQRSVIQYKVLSLSILTAIFRSGHQLVGTRMSPFWIC